MKALKQHEDKYLHISKETLANILFTIGIITGVIFIMIGVYNLGYDSGLIDGRNQTFTELENIYNSEGYLTLSFASGLELNCKEKEYNYLTFGEGNWHTGEKSELVVIE